MTHTTKKLIEVALPLDAINSAASHEESIRNGRGVQMELGTRRPC